MDSAMKRQRGCPLRREDLEQGRRLTTWTRQKLKNKNVSERNCGQCRLLSTSAPSPPLRTCCLGPGALNIGIQRRYPRKAGLWTGIRHMTLAYDPVQSSGLLPFLTVAV